MEEKKLLLIVNPCAGQKKAVRELGRVLEVFSESGYITTVRMTVCSGHAAQIAREHAREYDLIACAGGDGTLNETISGLLSSGAATPLAYLPCGTTNDLGATLGLSRDLFKAAQDAVGEHSRKLDIGSLNGRNFVYTASFGAFTRASYATPQAMKNALGHLAYVLEGAKEVWHLKGIKARIKTDAGDFEGEYLFGSITNSTSLAGIITLDKNTVKLDDGLFELMLVEKPTDAIEYSKLLSQLAFKRFDDKLKLYKVSRVEIHTEEPLDWTLDGELEEGKNDFLIENIVNAIEIKAPEDN
ncbi:MAG: diacylglycerol kinase family lipid kinase [Clostridia bacterium]|nr:diacylglycerol kinase family lipid kinase [Clostridia bacterium]